MDIFSLDWIGFIITGFGTLFLIGEMLVNMRGFFGLMGLGFITVYFAVYLETGSFIIMLIVYLLGLLLIIIDGKVINDGTLATIGLACMLTAVALTAPNLYAGMYAVIGVLLGGFSSLFFLKVFKRRDMWSKLTLVDQLTKEAGYNSMNEEYEQLLNEEGKTVSNLRPVGTVRIKNKNYSAISNGQWIPENTKIKVVDVDGTRILVENTNNE
ncbi:NfeD-like C-terminal, partner-binding [Virgibacillus subterraneus]|uniref:NfeD-like C-terminal, partner-binding n=2 Tax=Virgibacillus TaxID=84406 RepID=A0A1H1BCE5_9BACI|nr:MULTISPECIES: NfeD family protein [Virgibacillus]SDQ49567.1 NfeD-like C-terminal, partner-binding [Virgibacillus salinus]SEQ18520.1 NfeD-like C-terminal, partner-binding [Virgibacillus subterraneus]